jgi:hypothetical protein
MALKCFALFLENGKRKTWNVNDESQIFRNCYSVFHDCLGVRPCDLSSLSVCMGVLQVPPAELEALLISHEGILDAAVVP